MTKQCEFIKECEEAQMRYICEGIEDCHRVRKFAILVSKKRNGDIHAMSYIKGWNEAIERVLKLLHGRAGKWLRHRVGTLKMEEVK